MKSDPYLVHVLEIVGNAIVGGVEQYVHNLARHLPGQGFKVTCVSPYESPVTARLREIGSPVYITRMEDDPPWRSIQFLTELVRHQGIHLIHAHLPKAQILAGMTGCLTGTPVVTTIHGMDISSWELGIIRITGSHLTVVCQGAYAQALALGLPPDGVSLIPNGVDLRVFRPQNSGSSFRKSLGLPLDAPVVGFVGRQAWEKGPDMFLQLASHVYQTNPNVHFVMVGDGPMHSQLAHEVEYVGLEANFHFAGVWTNMREVYPAFDVLVQTSRVEGMPFTLLEGMASGVPVAAMNTGGVAELVEVGTTGLMSAVGDWAGLGNAVIKLIENPALCKEMGVAARRRVENYFDLNTSIESMAKLFRELIRRPDPTQAIETSRSLIQKDLGREQAS